MAPQPAGSAWQSSVTAWQRSLKQAFQVAAEQLQQLLQRAHARLEGRKAHAAAARCRLSPGGDERCGLPLRLPAR